MRFKLISCQVFCREIAAVMKRSSNEIDVEFLSKGLHEIPCCDMCRRIQSVVDAVDSRRFDAILLAYGFCNHGIAGLRAAAVPLVVPRAHDCITMLLGRERSARYREANPGAYFQSSGWIEHRKNPEELEALSTAKRHGLYATEAQLAERFGEKNAAYLREHLGNHTRHYSRLAYIRGDSQRDAHYSELTAAEATRRGWAFDELPADLTLLQRLVNGDWNDEDFLIVKPGQQIAAAYDSSIIQTEPAAP